MNAAYPWFWSFNFAGGPPSTVNVNGQNGYTWSNIYNQTVGGANANDYEVDTTITLKGNAIAFDHYLRASLNAVTGTGTYAAIELSNPTFDSRGACTAQLKMLESVNGSISYITGVPAACRHGMTMRSVVFGSTVLVFIDNRYVLYATTSIGSGQPGYGMTNASNGSWFTQASFAVHVTAGPNAIDWSTVHTSATPNSVRMQWTGATDPNGPGTAFYVAYRDGQQVAWGDGAALIDETVSPSTTYHYAVSAEDFHGNWGPPIYVTVVTPAAGAIDPRRVGLHATGSYWGGGGEQIDLRSGNLNYSLPLVQPKFRTGASIPLGLSYNSQNWFSDSGGVWQFGSDSGYGYGWRAAFGSIIPVWGASSSIDHYIFTDASGAEYHLTNNSGGVWSSTTEGIYVYYDPSTKELHFKNGSFWLMGSTASGYEPEAGTLYPTLLVDSNGNTITVRYDVGGGSTNQDTSARITAITDFRSAATGGCADANWSDCVSYRLLYNNDSPRHLTGIHNGVSTPETYAMTYQSAVIVSPYGTGTNVSAGLLTSFTVPTATSPYRFQYDSPVSGQSAGELIRTDLPYGGHLRWTHLSFQYATNRNMREVFYRYLAADSAGSTEWTYTISHDDSQNPNPTVHANTTLADASGIGAKRWSFYIPSTAPAAWQVGLLKQLDHLASSSGATLKQDAFTWAQDPVGNPYIGTRISTADPGTGNAQGTRSSQTLDQYGNVTQSVVYPLNSTTPLKTFTYQYLNASSSPPNCVSWCSQYAPNYIFDRLADAYAITGGVTKHLVQNRYDENLVNVIALNQKLPNASAYKGLVTTRITPAVTTNNSWWDWGVLKQTVNTDGTSAAVSTTTATNYGAPSSIVTESYSQSIGYDSFLNLTSTTGANGEQLGFTYDSVGRKATGTSPYGAVTNYSYGSSIPLWQAATGPNGVTRTTLDGLGRPIRVERGDTNGTKSIVDTVYSPCACSPMGKVQKVSQPYAPGTPANQIAWIVNSYDGLGRTASVVQADGASTTTYSYSGTQTTVTDPKGNWKKFTNDAEGNLAQVTEPDPANQPGGTLVTNYSYDWMNHLIGVSMPRSNGTQTRTFVYDDFGNMTSSTNPETGTVTYTYDSVDQFAHAGQHATNLLTKKHDAKGQDTVYNYGGRYLSMVQYYPQGVSNAEDGCSRVTYSYGGDPYNNSGYTYGRLASIGYNACGSTYTSFTDQFSYTPGGAVSTKGTTFTWNYDAGDGNGPKPVSGSYGIGYGYDTAGRLSAMSYPDSDRIPFATSVVNSFIPLTTVAYGRDSMGRLNSMTTSGWRDRNSDDGYVSNVPLVKNVQYDLAGKMTSIQRIASVVPVQLNDPQFGIAYTTETRSYNVNEQLTSIGWNSANSIQNYGNLDPGPDGSLTYQYSATQNNGQITGMSDTLSGDTVTYQYDSLKRLISASAAGGTQSYAYDGFGNLTSKTTNGTTVNYPADPATNRISNGNVGSAGMYDANGNMTGAPGSILGYDVANHVVSSNISGAVERYAYNAQNRRFYIRKSDGTEQLVFYGAYQEKVSDGFGQPVLWFGGRMIWEGNKPVNPDRVSSNRSGGAAYYPYGEERGTATANDHTKFATYIRDSFSGLDYADQRFYVSGYGRFDTPDPFAGSAQPSNPSSWHRYAYVNGDPVNRVDPSGLGDWCDDDSYECGSWDWDSFGGGYDPPGSYDQLPLCNGSGGNCLCIGAIVLDSACLSTYGFSTAVGWLDWGSVFALVGQSSPVALASPSTTWQDILQILVGNPFLKTIGVVLASPTAAGGHDEDCWDQYQADIDICRQLGSQSCYDQAAQRFAACISNKPIPPFPYQVPRTPSRPPTPRPIGPKRHL